MTRHNIIIISICFIGVLLTLTLNNIYFNYFEDDAVSYIFQAKLFASGQLSATEPPEQGFSPSPQLNILNGKWYSKYPFGNALMLALGELADVAWLIPALLTGATLALLYLIVRETYGAQIAWLALLIGLISPATLVVGATWFSEVVSRFYLALFVYALLRALKSREWVYPALSGFALGYAFNTRLLTALTFSMAGAALWCWTTLTQRKQRAIIKMLMGFAAPFSLMIILMLAWNTYFTGSPLKFTHNVMQPYDKLGFGIRNVGYDPDIQHAYEFTPKVAFYRIWKHVLPLISFSTLGWGNYRPTMFSSYPSYTPSVTSGLILKSVTEEKWLILGFRGGRKGKGQIEFYTNDTKALGSQRDSPAQTCGFGGKVDMTLRLVKHGNQYIGYFKTPNSRDWIQAGSIRASLKPPIQVGLYTGIPWWEGKLRANYDSFRVLSNAKDDLHSDNFSSLHSENIWRWSREPNRWNITDNGQLHIDAHAASRIWDGTSSVLYQVTNSNIFDIETSFNADWSYPYTFTLPTIFILSFTLVLCITPIFSHSRNQYDIFFISLLILNLLLYFFFYAEGSTWGFTPLHSRYYNECILLGIIPLISRGLFIVYRWRLLIPSRLQVLLFALLVTLFSANTIYSYIQFAKYFQNQMTPYQVLPRLVEQGNIHNAVIFVPGVRAPIGDYPAKSRQNADVIYFRLGPSRKWQLSSSNWRDVYKRYFKGRHAYMHMSRSQELAPLRSAIATFPHQD